MRNRTIRTLAAANFCVAVLATSIISFTAPARAQNTPAPPDAATIQKGLDIAPVLLNMTGKDKNQVGYGSYLVNAIGDCNGCHSAVNWEPDGDPFQGKQPAKVNKAGYLAGGFAFGPFISRNITPNVAGQIAGGGLENFKQIMRTGLDLRKLHPPLGPLLQVMPWPIFANMFDRELDAIFAYLTAVPCIEGGPGELPNRCAAATTTAVASPKDTTVLVREAQLDGSKSTSADGKPLHYLWTIPQGSPSAAIRQGDTATPTVQFGTTRGAYIFQLTVTDSAGVTSTDTVTVNFLGY